MILVIIKMCSNSKNTYHIILIRIKKLNHYLDLKRKKLSHQKRKKVVTFDWINDCRQSIMFRVRRSKN